MDSPRAWRRPTYKHPSSAEQHTATLPAHRPPCHDTGRTITKAAMPFCCASHVACFAVQAVTSTEGAPHGADRTVAISVLATQIEMNVLHFAGWSGHPPMRHVRPGARAMVNRASNALGKRERSLAWSLVRSSATLFLQRNVRSALSLGRD